MLVATILGSSMVFIDSSVVNVALPTIQRELGPRRLRRSGWSRAMRSSRRAAPGRRLARRSLRPEAHFPARHVLFAATSIWCGLSPDIAMLIAARAAQGVGAALLTPGSLAIISAAFGDETERGRAIGTWSGFTAITATFGPVLGGWLVDKASWRWVFFINLPFAVVVVAVALVGFRRAAIRKRGGSTRWRRVGDARARRARLRADRGTRARLGRSAGARQPARSASRARRRSSSSSRGCRRR